MEIATIKKAEHDAKVAQAAMENVKREAAKKRAEALRSIEAEEQAELHRYEQNLAAAKEES